MEPRSARKRSCLWTAIGCVTAPLLALILMVVILRTTFERYTQRGRNMEPTLTVGDVVLVRPATTIERGDLLVFNMPADGGVAIKRVIALPGDTVELRENNAIVNGVVLDEPYVAPMDTTLPENAVFRTMPRITVEPNAWFVLGDNRDHSNDSRFIGPVHRKKVRGRVVFVISKRSGMWRP